MDSAVGLIQTYLRVNGYFTVVEYPIVELRGDYRSATDVDILAFRFPGAERVIPGEPAAAHRFSPDPELRVPHDHADMIIGEVKEGEARFNPSGRRVDVMAAALARFGCCSTEQAQEVARSIVRTGAAQAPSGHHIRMVAFGSKPGTGDGGKRYQTISLGQALQFLEEWIDEHWAVLRHANLKDPTLSFLVTLRKARRGRPGERSRDLRPEESKEKAP